MIGDQYQFTEWMAGVVAEEEAIEGRKSQLRVRAPPSSTMPPLPEGLLERRSPALVEEEEPPRSLPEKERQDSDFLYRLYRIQKQDGWFSEEKFKKDFVRPLIVPTTYLSVCLNSNVGWSLVWISTPALVNISQKIKYWK